jgi:hypothetical protein
MPRQISEPYRNNNRATEVCSVCVAGKHSACVSLYCKCECGLPRDPGRGYTKNSKPQS